MLKCLVYLPLCAWLVVVGMCIGAAIASYQWRQECLGGYVVSNGIVYICEPLGKSLTRPIQGRKP